MTKEINACDMPGGGLNFVFMADHKFLRWLEMSVHATIKAHPGATVYLYDLSPDSRALAEFASLHSEIVHIPYPESHWSWPGWIDKTDFYFFWPVFPLRETLKYWSRRARVAITGRAKEDWMIDKNSFVENSKRFVKIVSLKPRVLQDALLRSTRNIVFMDADAIVLKPVCAVFTQNFDMAVTALHPDEIVIGPDPANCHRRPHYPHRAINTGVLFIRHTQAANQLLSDWIAEMESVQHGCVEQTALANLLLSQNGDCFTDHHKSYLHQTTANIQARILNLPYSSFNCTNIPLNADRIPNEVSIIHFAGGRKKESHWHEVISLLERSDVFVT